MLRRLATFVFGLALGLTIQSEAEAQPHRFKLGGGGGFAALGSPILDLGRSASTGGFFGVRFNDNLSVETTFTFARAKQRFTRKNRPVEEGTQIPAFESISNRYLLDGVLVYNFGRRQAFHPYMLFGGGIAREESSINDFVRTATGEFQVENRSEATEYRTLASAGAGFELYVLSNVAARFEGRWWIPPQDFDLRTRRLFFSATYFF